jgi:hypothetical protein
MYYCTLTEHDSTSGQSIFNWNTPVIGHKQWTIVFTQRKPLSWSTANSTVSNSNSGAFSVLLFHVSSFILTKCPNFSTKSILLAHYKCAVKEACCDQTLNSQTRTKMNYDLHYRTSVVLNTVPSHTHTHARARTHTHTHTHTHPVYPRFVCMSICKISVAWYHHKGNHASMLNVLNTEQSFRLYHI